MDRDYGIPLLPKDKRFKRTDEARTTAESADDFLKNLELLLDSPEEIK